MGSILKIDKQQFIKEIFDTLKEFDGSYIETIIFLCDKHGIDPSAVKKLIDKPLKEKIEAEAFEVNLLSKRGKK